MPIRNVPLLCQLAGYCLGLILSLCVVIPMSLHQDEFDGKCILFSKQDKWFEKKLYVFWASSLPCHYILFVGITSMVACLLQIYRLLMMWVENRESSFLGMFLEVAGCAVLSVLIATAGVVVSLGFMAWCQSVSQSFPSCEDVAGEAIDGVYGSTDWFYVEIDTAQVGVWALFATVVGVGVGATLKLLHQHSVRNLHAVLSCAADERRPLLNSGWPEEGRSTPPAEP